MTTVTKARFCGWGLLAGSIGLLILTGIINYFQGEHFGVTTAGKIIASASSVAVDIMGLFFCGLAAGVCFGIRRWGWGLAFGFAMIASGVWSINSMYSYQATERISASTTREVQNSRIAEADKLTKDSVAKTMNFAGRAKSTGAREDFMYGAQEAIKGFREAKVQVVLPPDAGAQDIAARLGWRLQSVQILQSFYIGALIIFLKMIGFPGSGFLLSWTPEPPPAGSRSEAPEPSRSGSGPGPTSGGGEPAKLHVVRSAEPERAVVRTTEAAPPGPAAEPSKVSSVSLRVSSDAPAGKLTWEQFRETIGADMAFGEPASSTRALAVATGWSQSSVVREQQRVRDRRNSVIRRFAGNGGGLQLSARG